MLKLSPQVLALNLSTSSSNLIVDNRGPFAPYQLIQDIIAAGQLSLRQISLYSGICYSRLRRLAKGKPYRMLNSTDYNRLFTIFSRYSRG